MPITSHRLSSQLQGVQNCPHCRVASPVLTLTWFSKDDTPQARDGRTHSWGAFACTTCGGVVSVKFESVRFDNPPYAQEMFPSIWIAHDAIPERARHYLNQASTTITSPDASVLMSTSAIDAMLKHENFTDGSLFDRIDQAVENKTLTQGMADWAHKTRIDSNNIRHADIDASPMSSEDAERAFEFAKSIAEILYVVPSRMPNDSQDDS